MVQNQNWLRCLVNQLLLARSLRAYDNGPKPNLTGFDIRKFAASAGQPRYDPWERAYVCQSAIRQVTWADSGIHREAWRYTGRFSRFNRFKGAFPGLGIATVAFAGYCAYEHFFIPAEHHSTGHGEAV